MQLPEKVRVKLSSEDAGSIALSQVVVQEMAIAELLGWFVKVVGKDAERLRGILARGSMVVGASRFRWTGFEAAREEIQAVLDSLV